VEVSAEVKTLLEEILRSVESVNDLVREVTAAGKEQARGVEQITTAISQMDQVTQANASNAEENAAASEELSSQAAVLTATVRTLTQLVAGGIGAAKDENGNAAVNLLSRGDGPHPLLTGAKGPDDRGATARARRASSPRRQFQPANGGKTKGKASGGLRERIEQEHDADTIPPAFMELGDNPEAHFKDL
jgi:methyl-accepting chemotaxis protein